MPAHIQISNTAFILAQIGVIIIAVRDLSPWLLLAAVAGTLFGNFMRQLPQVYHLNALGLAVTMMTASVVTTAATYCLVEGIEWVVVQHLYEARD